MRSYLCVCVCFVFDSEMFINFLKIIVECQVRYTCWVCVKSTFAKTYFGFGQSFVFFFTEKRQEARLVKNSKQIVKNINS